MRFVYLIITMVLFLPVQKATAQAKTEQELVQQIITILQTGDDSSYVGLFPNMKLMSEAITEFQPKDSIQELRINKLRSNMHHLSKFDPELTPKIVDMMNFVRKKGADSGVHWGDILIAKFELDKQKLPYELIGFELIAPLRMQGYIFIRDMLTRRRYAIAVRDMFLIKDKWYGGLTLNILEASNAAEYEESLAIETKELQRLMAAKREGVLDSVLAARDSIRKISMYNDLGLDEDEEEESELDPVLKEIVDRKVFTGYFDKTVEVELYIRYIKGACPQGVCSWEAMYKFGDLDEYIVLDVELRPDGTFVFTEEELGIMELKPSGDTFTGTWTSVRDKTEYEAYLKEKKEIKDRKLFKLDKTYEETRWK